MSDHHVEAFALDVIYGILVEELFSAFASRRNAILTSLAVMERYGAFPFITSYLQYQSNDTLVMNFFQPLSVHGWT